MNDNSDPFFKNAGRIKWDNVRKAPSTVADMYEAINKDGNLPSSPDSCSLVRITTEKGYQVFSLKYNVRGGVVAQW